MNNNACEETMENLFKQLTKEGSSKDLQAFIELSEKYFPSNITTTILKEMFIIACDERNYENMDYLFSLLGAKEIDEPTLENILYSSIRIPFIDPHPHSHSNTLKLLKYLEDKSVDLKNNLSADFILALLEESINQYSLHLETLKNLSGKFNLQDEQCAFFKYLLINIGYDLNELRNSHGESMMKYALESRNLKLIKYFALIEIDDIKKQFDGKNALYFVLYRNCQDNDKEQEKSIFKVVKYLVEKGVNIHECDNINGTNVLHLSAQFHTLEMIKYFISLGVNLHSLDHQNNNALLYALTRNIEKKENETTEEYSARYSEMKNRRVTIIKYLINERINVEQRNDEGMDPLLYSFQWRNFELIKLIADLTPSLKNQIKSTYNQDLFQFAIYHLLKSFNIEIFKYLDQFPVFADFFDGKNKINSKNYILFKLINWYIRKYDLKFCNDFKKFKKLFNFFLNKRNNINSIKDFCTPLQYALNLIVRSLQARERGYNTELECNYWKFFNFLIGKGSDLHHPSKNGSILHYWVRELSNVCSTIGKYDDYAKYFIIRSLEINNNINITNVNNIEEDKDGKGVINWKREFINSVIKPPKILEYEDRNNIQVILDSNNELHLNR